MNVSNTQVSAVNELSDDYNNVCQENFMYINEALEFIKKEEIDGESRKRAIDRLVGGLNVIQVYSRKHNPINTKSPAPASSSTPASFSAPPPPLPSLTLSPPPASSSALASLPSPTSSRSCPPSEPSPTRESLRAKNWEFIDTQFRGDNGVDIDWKLCYEQGRVKGLFTPHTIQKSCHVEIGILSE